MPKDYGATPPVDGFVWEEVGTRQSEWLKGDETGLPTIDVSVL